jgi:hypothetical protein
VAVNHPVGGSNPSPGAIIYQMSYIFYKLRGGSTSAYYIVALPFAPVLFLHFLILNFSPLKGMIFLSTEKQDLNKDKEDLISPVTSNIKDGLYPEQWKLL